jgi:predicted polyphosphate/ATP-dependent NAD kinase
MKIGFLINPIAGMGGRVGLKGTDGVLDEALVRGAEPVANARAKEALERFMELYEKQKTVNQLKATSSKIDWYTCTGNMGHDVLNECRLTEVEEFELHEIYTPIEPLKTTGKDTQNACKQFINEGVNLILFCGGDGTARDVYTIVQDTIPILGIPSGVKMHSGVFATHTKYAGELLLDFIKGEMDTATGEILDLDEDKYRAGEWNIRLFGVAKTPYEPTIIQRGKHLVESATEDEIKEDIAEFIDEEMTESTDTLYILGSGSTVDTISKHMGLKGTLLGIDAVLNKEMVGKDLNEEQLLEILDKHQIVKLLLSPIGAQGFILGRGNLQLSPSVIQKIGIENIEVVSTPAKLSGIEYLRVDSGEVELDSAFAKKGYLSVIIGYRQRRLKKVVV